jgi:UDP-N-acetylmuramyl tripeptide synthase
MTVDATRSALAHGDLRLRAAVLAGRATARLVRGLRVGGGTTLPGLVAQRLDAQSARKLAAGLVRGTAVTTGTNGKTTTSRLLSSIARQAGWRVVHNRAGANLVGGIVAALVGAAGPSGRVSADVGIFEVDEAAFPRVERMIAPRVVTFTNLFRDQLDRYGEVDYVQRLWQEAVAQLDPATTVVVNADDPLVAALALARPAGRVVSYGLDVAEGPRPAAVQTSDARRCPRCGQPLVHSRAYYGHVGVYRCSGCAFTRPQPDVRATAIYANGKAAQTIAMVTPAGTTDATLRLPGLYNVYNALAAAAAALALGIALPDIRAGLEASANVFGRGERIAMGDRELLLALIKNPVGCTEVLRGIVQTPGNVTALIIINDRLADGTDVSWLWDADFELLAGRVDCAIAAGTRAADMAVRLKYAGVPTERIICEPQLDRALAAALDAAGSSGVVHVLPTYTALLEFRELLARRGVIHHFWED